jgi:hypothetical protein
MREPTKSNVALLIGSREVHGTTATLEALRILLATIPRVVATSVLCYIGSHWPGDSADDWMELDRTRFQPFCLSPETRRAVARYAAGQQVPVVVFTRKRAMTLLRLAHAICPIVGGEAVTDEVAGQTRYAMGEAFLLVGELLEAKSETELDDPLALMAAAFEESNRPALMLAYSRVYKMVLHPSWGQEPILLDAASRFERGYGLSIRDYLYVIVSFVTKLLNRQDQPGHGLFKLTDVFARARDRDAIRRTIESISIPYSNISAEVGDNLEEILRSRAQKPFRSQPLIAFSQDDVFACTDFDALADQLSSGLFWKIFDLFTTDSERNQFSAAWGKLFEAPVSERLEAAIKKGLRGTKPRPRFFRSPPDENGQELTDMMIVCGPNVVLIECKAFILTEKAKYSGVSHDLIDEAKRKLLKDSKNGVQLVRALERLFRSATLARKYFGRHTITTVYPAVVCLDRAITIPMIGPTLDGLFRQQLEGVVPAGVEVKPLSILNADDADMMAAVIAAGKKPHAIFRDRFESDPVGANTFHNHMYDVMSRLGVEKPGEFEEFEALFEDSKTYWVSQADPPVFPQ